MRYRPAMPDRRAPDDFLPLSTDALLILLVLAARPLHGYGIIRDVEARSDGETILQTGALYRTLRHLLRDDLIEECAAPPGEGDDTRRRFYRPTRRGKAVLEAEVERMARLVRVARLIEAGKRPRLV